MTDGMAKGSVRIKMERDTPGYGDTVNTMELEFLSARLERLTTGDGLEG